MDSGIWKKKKQEIRPYKKQQDKSEYYDGDKRSITSELLKIYELIDLYLHKWSFYWVIWAFKIYWNHKEY